MGNPITILPTKVDTNGIDGLGSYYQRQTRTKQARPYNLPTAYERDAVFTDKATLRGGFTSWGGQANAAANSSFPKCGPDLGSDPATGRDMAINFARSKFLSYIREEAMLAVNYAERKQALGMIADRAHQLLRFTNAVRRGRFGDAKDALHLSSKQIPKGFRWRRTRSVSSSFLEWHFGWEPLVKDIWTACHLLTLPVAWPRVEATGKKVTWDIYKVTGSIDPQGTYSITTGKGKVRASMGADVIVSNPNIWLLNQLGLLNPASVVWELIPWSFLWDWVFNMGDWLAQWTDFAGLTLSNSWYSVKTGPATSSFRYYEWWGGRANEQFAELSGRWHRRYLGVPGVTLGKLPYKPLSAVRGVTAMSLLAQRLPARDSAPRVNERQFKNIAHPAWYGSYLR